uniref:tetratricopeptide repeat protein n=1 Tax=Eubacterium cellulosolvens TaxID=29322 RepID=UPI000489A054|nr:tetratricopeptide repeat protein [[Eubacterium] cellulosolvens]
MRENTIWSKSRTNARRLIPACLLAGALIFSGCGEGETDAYHQGIRALQNRDYAGALGKFQNSVDDGREAEGYRGIGIADMYLGKYEEASEAFSRSLGAVKYQKQNKAFLEDVLYYQAQAYLELEKYDDAATIYNQLLEGKNPGQAYLLRGKIYAIQNKFGQAGQDFQKAVSRNPSYEFYLEIYEIYVKSNRQADGAVFLQEAQRIKPSTGEDNFQLGRISYELKEYDKAEEYLKKAVNSGSSGAVQLLGKVYMDAGKKDKAKKLYQQCITDQTAPGAGYNGLALCAMEEGDYAAALKYVTKGLSEKDSREELLFNEIVIYEHQYDFITAAEKMQRFLASYPTNESAIRENKFLESRVKETQGTAKAVIGSGRSADGSDSAAEDGTYSPEDAGSFNDGQDFTDNDGDGIADDTDGSVDGTYYNGDTQEEYSNGYDSSDW